MNTGTVARDTFLPLVVERWDAIVDRLAVDDVENLRSLLAGGTEPGERVARVRALLFRGLPPDVPLWQELFGTTIGIRMATSAAAVRPDPDDLQRLGDLARGAPGSPAPSATAADPTPSPVAVTRGQVTGPFPVPDWCGVPDWRGVPDWCGVPDWRGLHAQVRAWLAQVASRPDLPASVAAADPAALIRLPYAPDDVRVPIFQVEDDGRVRAEVATINRLLAAERDPWGAACWWLHPHPWLGARPADLLGTGDPRLRTAARSLRED
jgi:hypothetical protein